MATVVIYYDDGTKAWWTVPDEDIDGLIAPVLGHVEGVKA
jgi:hypothetical protein